MKVNNISKTDVFKIIEKCADVCDGSKNPRKMYWIPVLSKDGLIQLFFHYVCSLFLNNLFCYFFFNCSKTSISFVLKIIGHFPPISFVFSLNNHSIKLFVQINCSISKIVLSIKLQLNSSWTKCFDESWKSLNILSKSSKTRLKFHKNGLLNIFTKKTILNERSKLLAKI